MSTLTGFLFHMDDWLSQMVAFHPVAAYLLFFCIVFSESAFFPTAFFLPGDGLLFGIGVLAANGAVILWIAIPVLIFGGVLGNIVSHWLGKKYGPLLFEKISWLDKKQYDEAHRFYNQHGNKAFLYSRFVPLVRSLVPFVAGIANMNKADFRKYNIQSVSLWVLSITLIAYFLGHFPFIKHHFTLLIFIFAVVSMFALVIGSFYRLLSKHFYVK